MSKGSDKNKLILVIVLFILVALVFAWRLNLLPSFGGSSGKGTAAPTPSAGAPGDAGAVSPTEPEPGNRRQAPPQ